MNQRNYTPNYEDFVAKFNHKKTTDDCYTPPEIYNTVLEWVIKKYDIDEDVKILRPFYPGGDYQKETYTEKTLVVDNPPFSILAQICNYYDKHGIKYFLFAPQLTLFSGGHENQNRNYIITGITITYLNGAKLNTSFTTNLGNNIVETAPDLRQALSKAGKKIIKPDLKKYEYPNEIFTASKGEHLARHGEYFKLKRNEVKRIKTLDAQKEHKKAIFGSGFLIGPQAKTRYNNALKNIPNETIAWKLSDSEQKIANQLGGIETDR